MKYLFSVPPLILIIYRRNYVMRYPAVSGTYYPSDKTELKTEVDRLLDSAKTDQTVLSVKEVGAAILPHGQLKECGEVMAAAYATMRELPSFTTFVILGTDHFGKGKPIAVSREDWRTPFGIVKNDRELANAIKRESVFADFDENAHNFEPACEVQLPFIQTVIPDASCVEISIASHTFDISNDIATAIYNAVSSTSKDIVLIGSTDFSQEKPKENADNEDNEVLELIQNMAARDVMETIENIGSSICGPAILGATIIYANKVGLTPRTLKRSTVPARNDNVNSFVSIAFGK